MLIPVGPYEYDVRLVDDYLTFDGAAAVALCDADERVIWISRKASPARRLSNFWHEFGHALKRELDISESDRLEEEPLCNLIALGMSRMDARSVARVHIYLTRGIDADEVYLLPGCQDAVPLIRYAGPIS